mmetsp:Transcript_23286/g.38577  ORF Transcript_23286/g.38577 Transcript_23286/m.38577 type:complete len:489 (+) Transcript_23286:146-1612(+)
MKVALFGGGRRMLFASSRLSTSRALHQHQHQHLISTTAVATREPPFKGSSIGSDPSMISANHRIGATTGASNRFMDTTALSTRHFSANAKPAHGSSMDDEYGKLTDEGKTFCLPHFELENGVIMEEAQLRYQTYGKLNPDTRDNVIVVCHALTGNASLHSWWGDLLGPQKAFDTSKYLIVCCNILGSCYGSTSPQSINPKTNRPYSTDFPDISVQDTVKLQLLLLQNELLIKSVKSVIGGSFGGMQAVEYAVQAGRTGGDFTEDATGNDDNAPPFVKSVIPIACGAAHTGWQIAVSEVQRQAIMADPHWTSGRPELATAGLAVARQIGMVSYRTAHGYDSKFGRKLQHKKWATKDEIEAAPLYGSKVKFQAQSYLQYQGEKFLSRYDPVTYVKMTEQMDSHNIARGRDGDTLADVLATVEIPALVMGIDSDVLYPLEEQEQLADGLPHGTLKIVASANGHDGFLLEQDQVGNNIIEFLNTLEDADDDE